ncbi:MAG: type II toxin-antitoxin system RelE/ParE family toxin [Candidatus Lokiarchaeota archaeon]|nr:type II toxin-antitoxin system RelE/ParE family toxin [Candidatus Lokiarchaeota archaeon]
MKLKAIFHPEAEKEMNEAIEFYNSRAKNLGSDFLLEVEKKIKIIEDNPFKWPIIEEDVRRCLLQRFPFGIMYAIEFDQISIIAIANLKRKPGYWKGRR